MVCSLELLTEAVVENWIEFSNNYGGTPESVVKQIMVQTRKPLILILDDLPQLSSRVDAFPLKGAHSRPGQPLYSVLTALVPTFLQLQNIPGLVLYVTGPSELVAMNALSGGAPLALLAPILLHPLTATDILRVLECEEDGATLGDTIGIKANQLEYFAVRCYSCTGGIGRVLGMVIRFLQQAFSEKSRSLSSSSVNKKSKQWTALLASTEVAVDTLLQQAHDHLIWAYAAFMYRFDSAPGGDDQGITILAAMLLMEVRFPQVSTVKLKGQAWYICDLALTHGLAFAPVEDYFFMLVAGQWARRLLATHLATNPLMRWVGTMAEYGGCMRGRAFELVCCYSLLRRSSFGGQRLLVEAFPHLGVGSMLTGVMLPPLTVVPIPNVEATGHVPTQIEKNECESRHTWTASKTIATAWLSWLLLHILRPGNMGIPVSALSGSSDAVVRLTATTFLSFLIKMVGEGSAVDWSAIKEEVSKVCDFGADYQHVVVVWSLHLAPEVRSVLGASPSACYGAGDWYYHRQHRGASRAPVLNQHRSGRPAFTIPAGMQLIIANPEAPSGGLLEVIGSEICARLRALSSTDAPDLIPLMSEISNLHVS